MISTELKELYQQVILDHNKSPRNYIKLKNADRTAEGYNPLCGDKINVYINFSNRDVRDSVPGRGFPQDNLIEDISFQGSGCAISKASASIMTSILKGKTKEEAERLFRKFQNLITGKNNGADDEELGKLKVLSGVKEFPTRVKCASLAWHTMVSALKEEDNKIITTE